MDAVAALADLTEISSQVEAAVLVDDGGGCSRVDRPDDRRAASALARTGADAARGRGSGLSGDGTRTLTQLEAAMRTGSVFVVRDGARTSSPRPAPDPRPGSSSTT